MTTPFKSQYSEHDAFYLRGDLLRSAFGKWDVCDPVAHCILDLVEAQHELADLFAHGAEYSIDNEAAFTAAVKEAARRRRKADARAGGPGQLA